MDDAQVLSESDDALVLVAGDNAPRLEARISGVLFLGPGDCLRVRTDGGDYLVVWPHGTTWDDGHLEGPGGIDYAVGDDVTFGGGHVDVADAPEMAAPAIPAECLDGDERMIIASGSGGTE